MSTSDPEDIVVRLYSEPYYWSLNRIAKATGMSRNKVHRMGRLLHKQGKLTLRSNSEAQFARHMNERREKEGTS